MKCFSVKINLMLQWTDLTRSYLVEARWYHTGYKPTFDEYLSNGLVSITGPLIVIHSYLFTSNPIRKEQVEFIEDLPDILSLGSEIFRLADDYGTAMVCLYIYSFHVCNQLLQVMIRGCMTE